MQLTDAQRAIINEKLSKVKNATCDSCGENRWTVSDRIFELREFNEGNLVIGGPNSVILPVISVNCTNCGKVAFYNALMLGLIKKNEPKK